MMVTDTNRQKHNTLCLGFVILDRTVNNTTNAFAATVLTTTLIHTAVYYRATCNTRIRAVLRNFLKFALYRESFLTSLYFIYECFHFYFHRVDHLRAGSLWACRSPVTMTNKSHQTKTPKTA